MALIWVVDDEPILLDLMVTILRLDSHDVKAMTDSAGAYDAILAAQSSVDLLITDTDMRPLSGFQLVKRLRRQRVDCPVIFISGHHGIAGIITESFGPHAVMEKPFSAAELRSAVRKTLSANNRKLFRKFPAPRRSSLASATRRFADGQLAEIDADQLTPEEQAIRLRRRRVIEEILSSDYYSVAVQRLRRFLADGEIPSDVAEKLAEHNPPAVSK